VRRFRDISCWLFIVVMVAISAGGCASLRPWHPPEFKLEPEEAGGPRLGWWHARFAMNWPQGSEPSWYMDLFLAHKVISPVLSNYRKEIFLWRFHRRAARDQAGHQFSFIFYSSPETARHVYDSIKSNSHLIAMRRAGVIIRATYEDTSRITRPNVEDTSDAKWSSAVQKSWPYYIMGVSQMWLDLIADFAGRTPDIEDCDSPEAVRIFYQRVNESIKETWQTEGDHAFLHHLNAVFGYEPIIIYEKRLMSF
jgi:hypothetical protein